MRKAALVLALLSLTVAGAAGAEEIKVGGGGASIATAFVPVKPHFEKATGMNLINLQSTPKNGLIDLVQGKLDAAVSAVALEGMIAGAEKDGVKVDPASLQVTPVAKNKTVAFVHKDNTVKKLSKAQLKGIFTGKIANWKEVGGPDKDIIVVWGKNSPGQNAQFVKGILDGEPVTKEHLEATDYASIKQTVASNPEGIGIDPLSFADDTFKPVEMDVELTSPIILITKGKPSAKVQKLIDFVKGEGQKYIK
ncbi:substrate-binding domain-containing protein [Geobacter sp. DSM 9736]|uniref:substrate-binding domain-containing protein n=1 Tax=Geobacter sp. DSM 9736 TaxID=1277350 RepID=UPI000B503B92|nr:substrate-binding domain-containing protein [Geobacter sp. DSM 9736]SNB46853.1 phosphate ABC transporter substrate-binding protein, PhoT family [Geobacter sp. DSM 9736]